jgi:hypothetical protein
MVEIKIRDYLIQATQFKYLVYRVGYGLVRESEDTDEQADPNTHVQRALQWMRATYLIQPDEQPIVPAQPMPTVETQAAASILRERDRQKHMKGYTEAKDNSRLPGELAQLAIGYIHDSDLLGADFRGCLVKAGALILAEIERIDRIEGRV